MDRFMLLVIFLNVFCCVLNFFKGNIDAGLGWMVAVVWSVKSHVLAGKIKDGYGRENKKDPDAEDKEDNDDRIIRL